MRNTLTYSFWNPSPKFSIDCGIENIPEARQGKMVCNVLHILSIFSHPDLRSLIADTYYITEIYFLSQRPTISQNFTIIHLLLLKWSFFQYNAKPLKKNILIAKFTKPVPNISWKGCYSLINFLKSRYKFFKKSITYLLYLTIL